MTTVMGRLPNQILNVLKINSVGKKQNDEENSMRVLAHLSFSISEQRRPVIISNNKLHQRRRESIDRVKVTQL